MILEKIPIRKIRRIRRKRKVIILFFVIVFSYGNTINIALAKDISIKNIKAEKLLENKKKLSKQKHKITNSRKKRELKREIKRRKKYHKSLLESYNNNFSNTDFNLITKNAELLSNLREQFKNKTYLT